MTNPIVVARHSTHGSDGSCLGISVAVTCPGCTESSHAADRARHPVVHRFTIRCPEHGGPSSGPVWDWDGNEEAPTFAPSLLVYGVEPPHPNYPRCHSFVRAGSWEYLTDSTHPLAGQTVPMAPLPDYLFP